MGRDFRTPVSVSEPVSGRRPHPSRGAYNMEYFIGLDLGSTAIKGVVVSGEGKVLGTAEARIQKIESGDETAFEIDPELFIDAVFGIIRQLSSGRENIKAISWVSASGNILLLDEKNQPCAPMISWLDTRPLDGSVEESLSGIPVEAVYGIVGWPFSWQFPFGRLLWLRENRPELMRRTLRICTSNDYLGYRLTGTWAIDNSTATTLYVYDQVGKRKNASFIGLLGLKPEMFSDLREVGTLQGRIRAGACSRTGLNENTQVFLGSFDHPGAARALNIHSQRQLLVSCGTSWVGLVTLPDRNAGIRRNMLLDPYESGSGGAWCGIFSLTAIGKTFDSWVAETFRRCGKWPELFSANGNADMAELFRIMNHEAGIVDPRDAIPVLDMRGMKPDAGSLGTLLGHHSPGKIFRALMECTAFEFKKLLHEKEVDLGAIDEISMVGGPTESPVWRQILADVLAKPVSIRFGKTAGAVGAAIIAANGAGFRLEMKEAGMRIDPDRNSVSMLEERYGRFREHRLEESCQT